MEELQLIFAKFFSTDLRVHPIYLLPFFVIGYGIYKWRGKTLGTSKSFLRWLFPKEIYLHPSHIVDLKLFVVGRMLSVFKTNSLPSVQSDFASLSGVSPDLTMPMW